MEQPTGLHFDHNRSQKIILLNITPLFNGEYFEGATDNMFALTYHNDVNVIVQCKGLRLVLYKPRFTIQFCLLVGLDDLFTIKALDIYTA